MYVSIVLERQKTVFLGQAWRWSERRIETGAKRPFGGSVSQLVDSVQIVDCRSVIKLDERERGG